MPELPEVETVKRGLNQLTLNQTVRAGDVLLDRTIGYPSSGKAFLAGVQGCYIKAWHRRGKYLLAELTADPSFSSGQSGGWLGVHLRMTGQLLWLNQEDPLQKHTRVRLFFSDHQELRFIDQRTFGRLWLVPWDCPPEQVITGLKSLGPEPFSPAFSLAYLVKQLGDRHAPIKTILLNQALVAGVGNIYADEALFLSGIRPTTPCHQLKHNQVDRLRTALIDVLKVAIESGGTTFSDFVNVKGINGNYSGNAQVYNREGLPCRVCGEPIQRLKLAGRSAHFCPHCQR